MFHVFNQIGMSPLLMAANTGPVEVVNALLKAGAVASTPDADGWTALTYVAKPDDALPNRVRRSTAGDAIQVRFSLYLTLHVGVSAVAAATLRPRDTLAS